MTPNDEGMYGMADSKIWIRGPDAKERRRGTHPGIREQMHQKVVKNPQDKKMTNKLVYRLQGQRANC